MLPAMGSEGDDHLLSFAIVAGQIPRKCFAVVTDGGLYYLTQ